MSGKSWITGILVGAALVPVLTRRPYDAVQAAAFRELLAESAGRASNPSRSVCLAVATGARNLSEWQRRKDPEPMVVARVNADHTHAYPASRCIEDADGVWDPAYRQAVLLGLGNLEWVSGDFVKAEGYWLLDGLSGQGFKLTLSRVGDEWQVDMAVPTWVS